MVTKTNLSYYFCALVQPTNAHEIDSVCMSIELRQRCAGSSRLFACILHVVKPILLRAAQISGLEYQSNIESNIR